MRRNNLLRSDYEFHTGYSFSLALRQLPWPPSLCCHTSSHRPGRLRVRPCTGLNHRTASPLQRFLFPTQARVRCIFCEYQDFQAFSRRPAQAARTSRLWMRNNESFLLYIHRKDLIYSRLCTEGQLYRSRMHRLGTGCALRRTKSPWFPANAPSGS